MIHWFIALVIAGLATIGNAWMYMVTSNVWHLVATGLAMFLMLFVLGAIFARSGESRESPGSQDAQESQE